MVPRSRYVCRRIIFDQIHRITLYQLSDMLGGICRYAGLFALYNYCGSRMLLGGVMGLISGMVIGLLKMFSIMSGPVELAEMSLNERRWRWIEASKSFQERPLLGIGFDNVAATILIHITRIFGCLSLRVSLGGTLSVLFPERSLEQRSPNNVVSTVNYSPIIIWIPFRSDT